MNEIQPFTFKRTKGIVWVCDLAKSSSYLNDNDSVDDIEEFIPRLYFVSKIIIESFGGKFLKWTGDGFLAFFEFELDRKKEEIASKVFNAAFHLSFMTNITQLGLAPKKKFTIRHGITYEKDALLMKVDSNNSEVFDIIGRSVVLAFRISSIKADFPSVATVKELIVNSGTTKFLRWKPTADDRLKFFKGEKFGTKSIYLSANKTLKKNASINSTLRKTKQVISNVESKNEIVKEDPIFVFMQKMNEGPEWCKEIIKSEVDFLKNDVLTILNKAVIALEKIKKNEL